MFSATLYVKLPEYYWSYAINRVAEGIDDYDRGQVQEIREDCLVTERGARDKDKDKLIILKTMSFQFYGHTLHLNLIYLKKILINTNSNVFLYTVIR